MSPAFEFDVCILGAGRVGLPLGLALLDVGLSVVGVDLDGTLREAVNAGRMPFREPGFEALVAQRRLQVHATPEVAARSRAIVITVGTPLHTHIETDLRQIRRAIDGLLPHLREGQLICLRSTVAPGTTAVVRDQLERGTDLRVGETLGLAYCPERIAEGKAREELRTLPQIVGAQDALSANAAATLFARLAPEVLPCDWITAELVKLSNNIVRYVHFAVANQMALVADTFGADIHKVRALANHGYPRNLLASPGLTAGTCLRKDFGMISEWCPYPDLLLAAWKMNEAMPAFLVRHLEQRAPLRGARVAVLGYTFKRDTDDARDSLTPKLLRYIERAGPAELRVAEPNLADPLPDEGDGPRANFAVEAALEGVDHVFVAMNHSGFGAALHALAARRPAAWVADPWDCGGLQRIFYQAGDLR